MKMILNLEKERLQDAAGLVLETLPKMSGCERVARLETLALLFNLMRKRNLFHRVEKLARRAEELECELSLFIESYRKQINEND